MGYSETVDFSNLIGVTLEVIDGAEVGSDRVTFFANDDRRWIMRHHQDCCETVELNEIIGDVSDLIGSPILRAEVVESGPRTDPKPDEYSESWTWTFYKIATIRGEVVLRWLGESNGYYSESVDFEAMS